MSYKIILFILSSLLFSCNSHEEELVLDSIIKDGDNIKQIAQKSFTDAIPTHFTDSAKIEALKLLVNKIELDTNLVLKKIIDPFGKSYYARRGDSIVQIDTAAIAYAFFRNDTLVKYVEGDNLFTLQTKLTKDRVHFGDIMDLMRSGGSMSSYYFYMDKLIYSSFWCQSSLSSAMCNSGGFIFSSYFYKNKIIDQSLKAGDSFMSNRPCPCSFEYDNSEKMMNSDNSEYAIGLLKRVDRIKTLINP